MSDVEVSVFYNTHMEPLIPHLLSAVAVIHKLSSFRRDVRHSVDSPMWLSCANVGDATLSRHSEMSATTFIQLAATARSLYLDIQLSADLFH